MSEAEDRQEPSASPERPTAAGRGVWRYVKILLPPLLLTPLLMLNFHMGTALFYLIGGIAFLGSLFSLLRQLVRRRTQKRQIGAEAVRPLATIVIFIAALAMNASAMSAAEKYAVGQAKKAQAQCQAQERCPTQIEGWSCATEAGRARCETRHGDGMRQFSLWYETAEGGSEFRMMLVLSTDEQLEISGGTKKALRQERIH